MPSSLRFMTANLLHERGDAFAFGQLLDRVGPDVVVTQELGPDCAKELMERYPHHRLLPENDFIGRGIASRPSARFGDISMPVRVGTWALLEVDGRLLRVAGMHLANPLDFPWWRSVGHRKKQLESLFGWTDAADDDMPLVVAGDMNASPGWPAYRVMADRWHDLVALRAAEMGVKPERTWGWRHGWPRMLRIDHVFGLGVEATRVSVEPLLGSDHHAVVVDMEIQA